MGQVLVKSTSNEMSRYIFIVDSVYIRLLPKEQHSKGTEAILYQDFPSVLDIPMSLFISSSR